MFTKLKQLFTSGKPASPEMNNTVCNPSDSFENFLRKLNAYFEKHPAEQQQFSDELYFINHLSHLSEEDKKLYSVMPYSFTGKYNYRDVEVFRDDESGMFYVYLEGKKLYYHKGFTSGEAVQKSFTYISAEQDIESPHRYLNDAFFVNDGDTVADFGAAEGNFSLAVIEKAKELFIVEADSLWIPALHKTFEPWQQKVHIINKFAGSKNSGTGITLTELLHKANIDVVKMDIEGEELTVLHEAKEWLSKRKIRFAITTYHHQDDAEKIQELLSLCGYQTVFSDKYILFVYDSLKPPYFRKGMIKTL